MAQATDLTYLQLRQRIVGNLTRDDLDTNPLTSSSIVHQFVLGRIAHYSNEYFYSAQQTDTTKSTVAGNAWVDLPDGWESIQFIRIQNGGVWIPLRRVSYETILISDSLVTPTQSLPFQYALRQNPSSGKMAARLFPVSGAVYSIEFTMDLPPAAPAADSDVNFWTCDAQNLIISATCEQICRERINRPMKADQHASTKQEEEWSLGSKTIRISGGIQARAW